MEKNKPYDMIKELKEKVDKDMKEVFGITVLDKLKLKGSEHYRSQGLQPFDVYKVLPCEGFTPFMIFCAFNIVKYVWRICNGSTTIEKDIEKIIHYAETLKQIRMENINETQKEDSKT